MSNPTPPTSNVPPQKPAPAQHHHHNGSNKPGAPWIIALVASFTFVAVVFFGMGAISGVIAGKLSGSHGHHSSSGWTEPSAPRPPFEGDDPHPGKPGLRDLPYGQSENDGWGDSDDSDSRTPSDESKPSKQGPSDSSSDGLLRAPAQGERPSDSDETDRFGYRFQSN